MINLAVSRAWSCGGRVSKEGFKGMILRSLKRIIKRNITTSIIKSTKINFKSNFKRSNIKDVKNGGIIRVKANRTVIQINR